MKQQCRLGPDVGLGPWNTVDHDAASDGAAVGAAAGLVERLADA